MEVWTVLRQTAQVTSFVAVMMIAVEYLNVLTRGVWPLTLASSKWKQYLVAVALGTMPGCLGAFAVVTLYTHRMISFGALVACMIATAGDESFVMFALFPGKALGLTLALALIGLLTGMTTDLLVRRSSTDSAACGHVAQPPLQEDLPEIAEPDDRHDQGQGAHRVGASRDAKVKKSVHGLR